MQATSDKYCVIGAGPSGLTAVKNLLGHNIPVQCIEAEDDVGGNWYFGTDASSVYESAHLISSKRMTEYTDFPMPKEYPPYPSHRQALQYLRDYANHFDLYPHIQFRSKVRDLVPNGDGWDISVEDLSTGELHTHRYRGVVIANGHHWDPLLPTISGEFSGEVLHSHDYKSFEQIRGKRVLVVGAGNSGCDIAVEAAAHAEKTLHSLRRGYHFLPKFLFGKPADSLGNSLFRYRIPKFLQRWITAFTVRVALGPPRRYGLPSPSHRLFESHPIINSQLLYHVGHGKIQVCPDVKQWNGQTVTFADGTSHDVDVVVFATGYKITFPFMDSSLLMNSDGSPNLFLNAFHPEFDNLFVAGLIQPNSGQWGITDHQTQLIAKYIAAVEGNVSAATRFRTLKKTTSTDLSAGTNYVDSPRHILEVDYYSYRERLKKLIASFG